MKCDDSGVDASESNVLAVVVMDAATADAAHCSRQRSFADIRSGCGLVACSRRDQLNTRIPWSSDVSGVCMSERKRRHG